MPGSPSAGLRTELPGECGQPDGITDLGTVSNRIQKCSQEPDPRQAPLLRPCPPHPTPLCVLRQEAYSVPDEAGMASAGSSRSPLGHVQGPLASTVQPSKGAEVAGGGGRVRPPRRWAGRESSLHALGGESRWRCLTGDLQRPSECDHWMPRSVASGQSRFPLLSIYRRRW